MSLETPNSNTFTTGVRISLNLPPRTLTNQGQTPVAVACAKNLVFGRIDDRETNVPSVQFEQNSQQTFSIFQRQGKEPLKYFCSHCKRGFSRRNRLEKHIINKHSEVAEDVRKSFKCLHCNKGFAEKGNLSVHMRIHSGDKPYACTHCEKRFSNLGNWRDHERRHNKQKPYACNLCEKAYFRNYLLTKHLVKKHNYTKEDNLQLALVERKQTQDVVRAAPVNKIQKRKLNQLPRRKKQYKDEDESSEDMLFSSSSSEEDESESDEIQDSSQEESASEQNQMLHFTQNKRQMHFVPPPTSIPNPQQTKSKQEVDFAPPFVQSLQNPKFQEALKKHSQQESNFGQMTNTQIRSGHSLHIAQLENASSLLECKQSLPKQQIIKHEIRQPFQHGDQQLYSLADPSLNDNHHLEDEKRHAVAAPADDPATIMMRNQIQSLGKSSLIPNQFDHRYQQMMAQLRAEETFNPYENYLMPHLNTFDNISGDFLQRSIANDNFLLAQQQLYLSQISRLGMHQRATAAYLLQKQQEENLHLLAINSYRSHLQNHLEQETSSLLTQHLQQQVMQSYAAKISNDVNNIDNFPSNLPKSLLQIQQMMNQKGKN